MVKSHKIENLEIKVLSGDTVMIFSRWAINSVLITKSLRTKTADFFQLSTAEWSDQKLFYWLFFSMQPFMPLEMIVCLISGMACFLWWKLRLWAERVFLGTHANVRWRVSKEGGRWETDKDVLWASGRPFLALRTWKRNLHLSQRVPVLLQIS